MYLFLIYILILNQIFLFNSYRFDDNFNNFFLINNNQFYNNKNSNNNKNNNNNNIYYYKPQSISKDLLTNIIQIFQIAQHDQQYLQANFDTNNFELIYPKNLDRLREMKRCVIGTTLRRSKNMVAIKLEFDNSVRAKYDYGTKLITCNINNIRGEPTEKYIATLMKNYTHFIKFYSNFSKQFTSGVKKINIYVYERLPKSLNLLQWSEKLRSNGTLISNLERSLKKYFSKIHTALSELHKEGYVYTDFKPENVLLDTANDKPYLIDLESVVTSKSKFVCLRTIAYTPPLYDKDGRCVDTDGLSSKAINRFFDGIILSNPHDRILSWTFCFSIYSLVCTRENEIHSTNFQSKYNYWGKDDFSFMTYFGCPTGRPSKSFTDLINGCLVKNPKKIIFQRLIKHPWLSIKHE